MRYLKNAWYVAALSTEVEGEALFSRKILGASFLIYRKQSGEAVALRDRCPHRFAPLHIGKRVGDDIVCAYHALRFDCSGSCVNNPHGDGKIPKASAVQSFPLVERHGLLWIWMGDAARADEALIPDYGLLTSGHPNAVGYGYMRFGANYELIVDNIMDLSHADYVHGPLISTRGNLSPLIPSVVAGERAVTARWDWMQTPAMLILTPFLPDPVAETRHFAEVQWTVPCNMFLTLGGVQGERPHEEGMLSWDYHMLTPESETTTHYFFASRRNWNVEDADYNKAKMEGMIGAFSLEDGPIIASVQEEMGTLDFWSNKPMLLTCDPAAVRVRRILDRLIQEEAQAAARIDKHEE